MAVTLADVDKWDPNLISEAFKAVLNRADATSDVHMGLAGLPAFTNWDGEAALAARAAVDKTRGELLLHAQEATMIAARANDAIELIMEAKRELREADDDAKRWGFKIDRTTGQVAPLDPSTIGQLDTNLHFVELSNLVQKILVEANGADTELAAAINQADGVEPVVTDPAQQRQQAIDESINRALHEGTLPPGVDPNVIRGVLRNAATQGFPAPRTGELGIPGYPDGSLTLSQARNVYTYGEKQMADLNQRLINEGMSPEMRAKTMFATRNALRSWSRDLMADRGAAAALNANEKNMTWEEITEKYSNQGLKDNDLWNKITEASMRSRASVNAEVGVDPQAPELPPMPGASGPAGPGVPLPEVPAPEPPPPPVIEAPPVPGVPLPELPEMPIIEP